MTDLPTAPAPIDLDTPRPDRSRRPPWVRALWSFTAVVVLAGGWAVVWLVTHSAAPASPPQLAMSAAFTPPTTALAAPVYLTIANAGDSPDTLTAVGAEFQTAAEIRDVRVCANADCSGDATITIPAHSTVTLRAGGPHLLVTGAGSLAVGHHPLQLTLTFAHSGVLHALVPIGTAADLTENDVLTYGFMGGKQPGMGDMPGSGGQAPTTAMPGMSMPGG